MTQDDPFEVQMRGYSRRQVDEFVARTRSNTRDLEERLSRSLDEMERLRLELSTARQAASGGKPHEELSERMRQILKLADDEATAQKKHADEEIAKLRDDADKTAEQIRTEAKEQSDRMLAAAQEQAERTIASARSEAEKTRGTARADAERMAADSRKSSETAINSAKSQAKQMLDEATARASAIHDGAERRLDLLKNRHSEAMRRLTEIRDVVTDLVAHDEAKGTLDEEVEKTVAATLGTSGTPGKTSGGPASAATASAKPKPATETRTQRPAAAPATSSPATSSPAPSPAAGPGSSGPGGLEQDGQQPRHAAPSARASAAERTMPQAGRGTLGDTRHGVHVPEPSSPDDVRVIIP